MVITIGLVFMAIPYGYTSFCSRLCLRKGQIGIDEIINYTFAKCLTNPFCSFCEKEQKTSNDASS